MSWSAAGSICKDHKISFGGLPVAAAEFYRELKKTKQKCLKL